MFSMFLGVGKSWKVDHDVYMNLCDCKVGWESSLEMCVLLISNVVILLPFQQ
jgi:hypothetical protein